MRDRPTTGIRPGCLAFMVAGGLVLWLFILGALVPFVTRLISGVLNGV